MNFLKKCIQKLDVDIFKIQKTKYSQTPILNQIFLFSFLFFQKACSMKIAHLIFFHT